MKRFRKHLSAFLAFIVVLTSMNFSGVGSVNTAEAATPGPRLEVSASFRYDSTGQTVQDFWDSQDMYFATNWLSNNAWVNMTKEYVFRFVDAQGNVTPLTSTDLSCATNDISFADLSVSLQDIKGNFDASGNPINYNVIKATYNGGAKVYTISYTDNGIAYDVTLDIKELPAVGFYKSATVQVSDFIEPTSPAIDPSQTTTLWALLNTAEYSNFKIEMITAALWDMHNEQYVDLTNVYSSNGKLFNLNDLVTVTATTQNEVYQIDFVQNNQQFWTDYQNITKRTNLQLLVHFTDGSGSNEDHYVSLNVNCPSQYVISGSQFQNPSTGLNAAWAFYSVNSSGSSSNIGNGGFWLKPSPHNNASTPMKQVSFTFVDVDVSGNITVPDISCAANGVTINRVKDNNGNDLTVQFPYNGTNYDLYIYSFDFPSAGQYTLVDNKSNDSIIFNVNRFAYFYKDQVCSDDNYIDRGLSIGADTIIYANSGMNYEIESFEAYYWNNNQKTDITSTAINSTTDISGDKTKWQIGLDYSALNSAPGGRYTLELYCQEKGNPSNTGKWNIEIRDVNAQPTFMGPNSVGLNAAKAGYDMGPAGTNTFFTGNGFTYNSTSSNSNSEGMKNSIFAFIYKDSNGQFTVPNNIKCDDSDVTITPLYDDSKNRVKVKWSPQPNQDIFMDMYQLDFKAPGTYELYDPANPNDKISFTVDNLGYFYENSTCSDSDYLEYPGEYQINHDATIYATSNTKVSNITGFKAYYRVNGSPAEIDITNDALTATNNNGVWAIDLKYSVFVTHGIDYFELRLNTDIGHSCEFTIRKPYTGEVQLSKNVYEVGYNSTLNRPIFEVDPQYPDFTKDMELAFPDKPMVVLAFEDANGVYSAANWNQVYAVGETRPVTDPASGKGNNPDKIQFTSWYGYSASYNTGSTILDLPIMKITEYQKIGTYKFEYRDTDGTTVLYKFSIDVDFVSAALYDSTTRTTAGLYCGYNLIDDVEAHKETYIILAPDWDLIDTKDTRGTNGIYCVHGWVPKANGNGYDPVCYDLDKVLVKHGNTGTLKDYYVDVTQPGGLKTYKIEFRSDIEQTLGDDGYEFSLQILAVHDVFPWNTENQVIIYRKSGVFDPVFVNVTPSETKYEGYYEIQQAKYNSDGSRIGEGLSVVAVKRNTQNNIDITKNYKASELALFDIDAEWIPTGTNNGLWYNGYWDIMSAELMTPGVDYSIEDETLVPQTGIAGINLGLDYPIMYGIAPRSKVKADNTVDANDLILVKVTENPNKTDISNATVTLTDADSFVYDGTEKWPTVEVSLGGTVISNRDYEVIYSNSNANDVSGNVCAGTVTVTIKAREYGNYSGTVSTAPTFTIAKKPIDISGLSWNVGTYTYSGAAQGPSLNGPVPSEITVAKSDNSFTNAGDYTAKATCTVKQEYVDNYEISGSNVITANWSIAKATPDMGTVSASGTVYSSMTPAEVVLSRTDTTVPGTLALTDTALSTGTGTYNWKFIPNASNNYEEVTGTVSIDVQRNALSSLTVSGTLAKTSYVYDDTLDITGLTFTAHFADNSTSDVTSSVVLSSGSLKVGDTTATVSYTSDGDTQSVSVSGFTVGKKPISLTGISWSVGTYEYDGNAQGPSLTGTIPTQLDVVKTDDSKTDAGSYTAKATFFVKAGDAANYEISGSNEITANWTIASKDITGATVTLGTALTYNAISQTQTIASVDLNGTDITSSVNVTGNQQTNAGTYTLVVTGTGNYTGSVDAQYTIAKAVPNIGTVTPSGTVYNSMTPGQVSLTYANTSISGTIVLTDSTLSTSVSTYNWEFTPADSNNYVKTTGTVSITVQPNTLTSLTVSGTQAKTSYVYGDTLDITGLTFIAHFADGSTSDVTSSVVLPTSINVGDTTATVSYTSDSVTETVDLTITVGKKPISLTGISWSVGTYVYDGTTQGPSLIGTIPAQLDVYKTDDSKTDAGSYTAKAKFTVKSGDAANYEISGSDEVTANWSIAKKSIANATITLGAALTYDGTSQTQTITSVDLNGTDVKASVSVTGDQNTDAGTYTLVVTGTGNYTGSVNKSYTIAKKTVTPSLNGAVTKEYDGTTSIPSTATSNTLEVTISGVESADVADVTVTASYAYASAGVDTGITVNATNIKLAGSKASNYELSVASVNGAVGTITKTTPTITLGNLSQYSNANSAVTAVITPNSIDATVTVEYEVLITPAVPAVTGHACKYDPNGTGTADHTATCATMDVSANQSTACDCGFDTGHAAHDSSCGYVQAVSAQPAVYGWTESVPTAPGTYAVRAYIKSADAGANLNEITLANAVTGTLIITQYVAPNPPASNDDDDDDDDTPVTEPVKPEPVLPTVPQIVPTPAPAPAEPVVTPVEPTAPVISPVEAPVIEVEIKLDSPEAWSDVTEELVATIEEVKETEGATAKVEVVMGDAVEVPVEIFEAIKGKDVDVVFEMADGISWTVNGMSVGDVDFENINLSVAVGESNIPEAKIEALTAGNSNYVNISLAYDGPFEFEATLTINVEAGNAGKYANLYYYNETTGEYELLGAGLIGADGNVDLAFVHASDYTILITEESLVETAVEAVVEKETVTNSNEVVENVVSTVSNAKNKNFIPVVLGIIAAVALICAVVALVLKKKEDAE